MDDHPTNTAAPGHPAASLDRGWYVPRPVAWVVLGISLVASAGGWIIAWRNAELEARRHFEEVIGRCATRLQERMLIYEDVLHGAAGLYAASYSVERAEWQAYLHSVSIEQRFPGIDSVGFAARVPPDQLQNFLQRMRTGDAPEFEVRDASEQDTHDLIIIQHLAPEARHEGTLGWNMGVDPARRAAAQEAARTGQAILTSVMHLSGPHTQPQRGCLMLLPVYGRGAPVPDEPLRETSVEGWVFARFILDELMNQVLGADQAGLHLRVVDAAGTPSDHVVFDSHPEDKDQPAMTATLPKHVAGRDWRLHFYARPEFAAQAPRRDTLLVGIGGSVISLLLFGIAWSLSHTRERALVMAQRRTSALRETNERLEQEARERRRSEAALRHSEALYHSLVENLPLSILRKDLEGRILFANQRFCQRFGTSLDTLRERGDAHLFPPEVAARRAQSDQEVLRTGRTVEEIEERPQPDGSTRYVQAIRTPLRDDEGNRVGLLGIFWDVTDKRRAEADLEHERFLLRTLMDNLPDRIYFKDRQSRFLRNSRAHLKRLGIEDPRAAIGRSDFDFLSEESARRTYQDEQQVIRTGHPLHKEEKTTSADGLETWALITKMPLRDEEGNLVGTFGISRDITDRKHAEEAMRRAKETAEEASRAKSQFLASMSHELRTPLNSVIGFANILLKNKAGTLGAVELNFLDRILANGKHLLALINEILDLSKIEARKVELQLKPVALDTLVRETIAQQEGLVRDKPIKLRADVPPQVAPIHADPDKLKQVLINLMGNALKFTEQGSVTVRLVTDPATHQPLRLDVMDTGIGIPQDKLGVIFEAFRQAEVGTARKYGGTGLGLTISQALCQLMGYRVTVTSEVGRGSTFTIHLGPGTAEAATAPSPAAPSAPATPPEPAGDLRGKLVLVIDDELDSRTLLTHMIEDLGCKAIAASSGEQGLHMAREFRPHVITVDLMMPEMDGWQVIRALKAAPDLRDIPVVVVSIVAGENRGGILGAVDVLQKPVSRDDLLAALRRSLPSPNPRILIVDDEADARHVLAAHLEDEPCQVQMAANGREALTLMQHFAPDLILLDLMMPVMDGMTFLKEMRALPRFQWVPVVVVTSRDLTAAEVAQLRQTTQEIVKKGDVFEADLKGILHRLLQARPPHASASCP